MKIKPIRWRLFLIQLAICLVGTVVFAALDDETLSLQGLTHYKYMPAGALFAFVFLPVTTVAWITYNAYREQRAPRTYVTEDGKVAARPKRWRLLLLQVAVSFALFLGLAFLDDEVNTLGDLMRLENAPAAVLYTLFFFVFTVVARLAFAGVSDTGEEVSGGERAV